MYHRLTFVFILLLPILSITVGSPSRIHLQSSSSTHAILVAGTSGWINYRHQANIAHGYRVLRSHGVPSENIIVMSFNDVAYSDQNPMKGKLFNSPNGIDVYSGLKVDYSGDKVTLNNFMNILKGSSKSGSSSKVLKSGPNDSILIYISSYGSTGLIGFPKEIMTSNVFNQALIDLKNNQKFSQLVIYLDSDYSGSMFESVLPSNISVYSVSSSSADQINVASYCNTSFVPYTCLSNSFSSAWLSHSGAQRSLNRETLSQQFKAIIESLSRNTSTSVKLTPSQFGDLNLGQLNVGKFMGSSESVSTEIPTLITDQMTTFDVPLEMARARAKETHNDEPLLNIINSRRSFDRSFYHLIDDLCWRGYCSNATIILTSPGQLINHNIYHLIVTKFHSDCLNIAQGSYTMSKMFAFNNIINESEIKISQQLESFLQSMYQSCRRHIMTHRFEDIV